MKENKRTVWESALTLAEEGEIVPSSLALLGREALTEQEREYAERIVEERAKKWRDMKDKGNNGRIGKRSRIKEKS